MFGKKRKINAKVLEFTYDDVIILEHNRWAVDVNFTIIGEGERKARYGLIYTLVCSPEFQLHPSPEYKDYIDEKTIVMEFLNKEKIESEIRKKIQEINAHNYPSWKEYYDELRQYYYIDD